MKQKLFALSITILSFAACNKGELGSQACSLSNTSIVGTYMLTGATFQKNASSPVIDEFSTYVACTKDDKITLNTNGTVVIDDAGMVCTPTSAATDHWNLQGNMLYFSSDTFTVKSFDCKTLVLTTSYSPGEIDTKYLTKQ